MTSKTQTMLTIALTAAVTVLMVDRIIEPAQAQNCTPSWMVTDVNTAVMGLNTEVGKLRRTVDDVYFQVTLANVKLDALTTEQ